MGFLKNCPLSGKNHVARKECLDFTENTSLFLQRFFPKNFYVLVGTFYDTCKG
jgi:hypothetical protein